MKRKALVTIGVVGAAVAVLIIALPPLPVLLGHRGSAAAPATTPLSPPTQKQPEAPKRLATPKSPVGNKYDGEWADEKGEVKFTVARGKIVRFDTLTLLLMDVGGSIRECPPVHYEWKEAEAPPIDADGKLSCDGRFEATFTSPTTAEGSVVAYKEQKHGERFEAGVDVTGQPTPGGLDFSTTVASALWKARKKPVGYQK